MEHIFLSGARNLLAFPFPLIHETGGCTKTLVGCAYIGSGRKEIMTGSHYSDNFGKDSNMSTQDKRKEGRKKKQTLGLIRPVGPFGVEQYKLDLYFFFSPQR